MAGLFFCLASVEGAGLLFLPCCNTAPYKRLQCLLCRPFKLYRPRYKTAHRALQTLFLQFVPFYRRRYQTGTSGYNTARATLERITAPQHLQHIPNTAATPNAVQGSTAALFIIRYIKVRPCYGSMPDSAAYRRPCQPGGLQSGPGQQSGRGGSARHPSPGGAVQRRAARNH